MRKVKKIVMLLAVMVLSQMFMLSVSARTIHLVNTAANTHLAGESLVTEGDYAVISTNQYTSLNAKLSALPTNFTYYANNAYRLSPVSVIKSLNGFSVNANVGKTGSGTVDLWNGNTWTERINIVVRNPVSSYPNGEVKGNNTYYKQTKKSDELWLYTNQSHSFNKNDQSSSIWVSQWFKNMSETDTYVWDDNGANNFTFLNKNGSVTGLVTGSKAGDFKLCCHTYQYNDGHYWGTIHCWDWWTVHLTQQPYLSATTVAGNDISSLVISNKTKEAKIKIKNNYIVSDDIKKKIYIKPSSEDYLDIDEDDGVYTIRAKDGFDSKKTAYVSMSLTVGSGDGVSNHNGTQVIIKELPVKLQEQSTEASKDNTGTQNNQKDKQKNPQNSGQGSGTAGTGIKKPKLSAKSTVQGVKLTVSTPYRCTAVIYRKTSEKGKFKKIKTLPAGKVSYLDQKARVGKKSFYRCRIKVNGKYSSFSPTIKAKAKFGKARIKTVGKIGSTYQIRIKGKKYTGFVLYYGDTKKNTSKLKTIKSKVINTGIPLKGKYLRVKSYKKYGKKIYYGKISKAVKVPF